MIDRKHTDFRKSLGAGRVPHSNSVLLSHLTNVHGILDREGHPANVCLAGLYHSVYGTESFKHALLGIDQRYVIRELIGEHAERLVYIFCQTANRAANFIRAKTEIPAIPGDMVDELIAIEIANLTEQGAASEIVSRLRLCLRS